MLSRFFQCIYVKLKKLIYRCMAIQRQLHVTNSGKILNVTKQPCHARALATINECHYFYHKQYKICRWRTNVKKTDIFIAKAIASGTIVSSTNQEGHYSTLPDYPGVSRIRQQSPGLPYGSPNLPDKIEL